MNFYRVPAAFIKQPNAYEIKSMILLCSLQKEPNTCTIKWHQKKTAAAVSVSCCPSISSTYAIVVRASDMSLQIGFWQYQYWPKNSDCMVELIRRAIWKLHWHLKKLLYDEVNDLFWIRAKLITTLSMRHAYIGPLDGGSGRGEVSAIFLITKISYVFCSVWVTAICLMTTKCNFIFGGSLMKYYRF